MVLIYPIISSEKFTEVEELAQSTFWGFKRESRCQGGSHRVLNYLCN